MTTAVHGKASLADLLRSDATSSGKNTDDHRDQTNTVDFGATLTTLIDRRTSARSNDPGSDDPSGSGAGSTSVDAKRSNPRSGAEAAARSEPILEGLFLSPSSRETPSPTVTPSTPRSGVVAAPNHGVGKLHDARPSSFASIAGLQRQDPSTSFEASNETVAARNFESDPRATAAPVEAANSKLPSPAEVGGDNTALKVAPPIDSAVPDADISLELRKQTFSAAARDDAAATPIEKIPSNVSLAKVAKPAQIDATASNDAKSPVTRTDPVHSNHGRTSDGTSPALSSEAAHQDAMNLDDPKLAQSSVNQAGDAAASSAQLSAQKSPDAIAPLTPQLQRLRTTAGSRDAARQSSDSPSLASDAAASGDGKPVARTSEAAAIRLTPEVTAPRDPAHAVSITVQLASGQTAQASVRERAGAVDVKILTPTAASAQRVSSEMDGMRQNLDAAGIKLGHSEVSYQRGDGGQQGHREGYRPPAQNQSATGSEVFSINEVAQ